MKIQLNLGSGSDTRKSTQSLRWINLDVRKLRDVDVVGDIRYLPFKNNKFDKISILDVLEHVSRFEVLKVLKEVHRILKKKGKVVIQMPNIDSIVARYVKKEIGITEFVRLVYGNADYEENTHKTGTNPWLITELLREVGFSKINLEAHPMPPISVNNMVIRIEK